MAVGTGNIWRFPRVAASQGGGAFIVAMIIGIFLWAVPLLIAESAWGKASRMGVVGSFNRFVGKKHTWWGGVVAWISLGITFYYAVVLGWCLRYLVYALTGALKAAESTEALWTSFTTTPYAMVPWHLLAMVICTAIIMKGVAKGIEVASKIFIPTLFVLLIVLAIKANLLEGAVSGLQFLFQPQWGDLLNARTWIEAFTQAAWSTGAGWGLMLTYFAYTKKSEDCILNAVTVCFADTSAAMLAGLVVIPTVFAMSPTLEAANKVLASGNNGITFVQLTKLFNAMPGGTFMAIIFFFALSVAALSSLIAMVEMGTRLVIDAGIPRKKAALYAGLVITLLGLPSSIGGTDIVGNQDWVWGVGLLASGIFFWLGAMKKGVNKIWTEVLEPSADLKAPFLWKLIYLFPVWFVILFGFWAYQSMTWYPDTWMKWLPISEYPFTFGTIVYQWAICFGIIFILNSWLAKHIRYQPLEAHD